MIDSSFFQWEPCDLHDMSRAHVSWAGSVLCRYRSNTRYNNGRYGICAVDRLDHYLYDLYNIDHDLYDLDDRDHDLYDLYDLDNDLCDLCDLDHDLSEV